MSRSTLRVLVLAGLSLSLGACAAPGTAGDPAAFADESGGGDATPATSDEGAAQDARDAAADVTSSAALPGDGQASDTAAASAPTILPAVAGAPFATSVYSARPFGPAPGCDLGTFDMLTDLVDERYLQTSDPARMDQLDQLLDKADIAWLTPAFLNACIGLDMSVREDVERATALTEGWYVRQARYKQVVLAGRPDALGPTAVQARLATLDGWKRWWERTIEKPESVERFRQRVREILAALRTLEASRPASDG
ncbi:MAG: hypothetical protein H6825_12475 [Planctomycetes bacterium]|nr:hypothetical protein [Planctomycetota bacterium]